MSSSTWLLALPLLAVALALGGGSCGPLPSCSSGTEIWNGDWCQPPSAVHLNTVGFLPDRAKLAVVSQAATTFSLVRADGSEALSGNAAGPVHDGDTGLDLWTIDFSWFTEPGTFYLDVPGVGRSVSFRIDANVYADVTKTLMLGMHGQRCGAAVEIEHDGKPATTASTPTTPRSRWACSSAPGSSARTSSPRWRCPSPSTAVPCRISWPRPRCNSTSC